MDPLVRHLASFVETVGGMLDHNKGDLGACADDAGLLVAFSSDTLRRASEPFSAAEELALPSLKPRTCVAVPLSTKTTPATTARAKALLADLCPSWGGFSVSGRA
eukprot:1347841-Pyramimonas_sp.AAC.1